MSSNIFEDYDSEELERSGLLDSDDGDKDDELSLEVSSEEEDDDMDVDDEQESILQFSDDDDDSNGEMDDDLEGYDIREALRGAGNFKSKSKKPSASSKSYWKRKMMKSTNRELDPEVRINLSQANEAYVRRDYQEALSLYLEVIKKDSRNFSAYKTLGEIYKQQGQLHKCCNMWLIAANIHPWDSSFWGNVAEMSSQLGGFDQAIYCYGKAINNDSTKNPKYIIERALLYKERKQYGRALEGFQKIHHRYPKDTSIIKELASIYVEQKRVNDAINLYMRILDNNINPESNNGNFPKFGWAELNILCELYLLQHAWRTGVKVIKLASRWIQGREDEKWWDESDDDSEFDRRRFNVLENLSEEQRQKAKSKFYDLPIDIRFKLGSLRLGLEQKSEALHHFEFLLEESGDISDLHFDTGKSLEMHGYYEEALVFLTRASLSDEQSQNPELVSLLGKCFMEVGDYQQSVSAYNTLLHSDPRNLDIKLALAEALYHLGEGEKSLLLLKDVSAAAEKDKDGKSPEEEKNIEQGKEDENLSLIKNKNLINKRNNKLSDEERMEFEEIARRKVLEKFRRMERLAEAIDTNEEVAVATWMQLASQLIEIFVNNRAFFPKDKNRVFKGIILHRRKKPMGIDEKLARVYNLYEVMVDDDNSTKLQLSSTTEYRGLNYDTWFFIFIQYAILLHRFDQNTDYASQIIDVAKDINVFVQDKNRESMLNMMKLIFGIKQGNMSTAVMSTVRFFLSANQFSPYIYKFFMCCFASGVDACETFANYNHQKFFLRQLKAYDSILCGKKISGMATVTANLANTKFTREHPELLYVYANLLGGSRSYVSSIVYLNRAYKEYNKDPMLCLLLGLAHVHRSMQRLSNNRHIQLLQGMSYFIEYKDLKKKNATMYEIQEIEYNFGRLFHMIGLTSEATQHYEKVLQYHESIQDPAHDLLYEAAYNLYLIYNISGNSLLARDICEQYLTV